MWPSRTTRHDQGRGRRDRPLAGRGLVRAARRADLAGDPGARPARGRGARLHRQRGRAGARARSHRPRRRAVRLARRTSASSASSRRSGASSAGHDLHMVVVDARGEPERERHARPPARRPARRRARGLAARPVATPRGPRSASRSRSSRSATRSPGPTVGEVLFDNRAGVGARARAPARARPPARRGAHARAARRRPTARRSASSPRCASALGLEATVVNSRHSIEDATSRLPRPAARRAAADRRLLPLGLDRLRRLRGGRRAGARRSRATSSVAGYDGHPIAAWSRRR